MKDNIPVLCPTFDERTKKELLDVLDSGWVGFGSKTKEFERQFANYIGAKYCVATNSGTSALDLCLKAYGIKGGELITTPMTFVSDAIVGEWNGMDVTFADIDEKTLCLDPETIVITKDTKAIITVDSHGRLADIDGIRIKIEEYNAEHDEKVNPLVIEDAAHAMYTQGAGKKADITIWSFQAVKSMPIFDGGAVTTNSDDIYKRIRDLTWLGIEKSTYERVEDKRYSWDYDIKQADGIKAYMTDVQAIIGLGQLRRLPELLGKRRAIQAYYNDAFRHKKQIKRPKWSQTCQYYTIQCERRDELSNYLAGKGITTSVHFKPLNMMTYWKKAEKRPLPVNNRIWTSLLTLPCHDALTWEECEYIIKCVKEFYEQ
jgi:dTDP-4-amino-4,6-dideoxygalactose transaminase